MRGYIPWSGEFFEGGKMKGYLKRMYFLGAAVFLCACSTGPLKPLLSVNLRPPVVYESKNGDRFVAQYGSLSDESLHFVKLKTPDGRDYTLPQIVSGSGARYTDEREIVWWTHHGTVRVDVRDSNGGWTTRYSDLEEVGKRN
jgi:membrane-bound inhibitor of C-type lysozyme